MKSVSIAGATGSIGSQALRVLSDSDDFQISALSANESAEALAEIAKSVHPEFVVLGSEVAAKTFSELCPDVEVLVGEDGLVALSRSADTIINSIIGFNGLRVTLSALESGKRVGLANKESMVSGGSLVKTALQTPGAELIPVDSEHSAIHQCIGNSPQFISELILTSTGGPFRSMSNQQLQSVTKKQALAHPKWNMGEKITIDSSTLMNKGLELIEANQLFNIDYSKIRVVVHPQAIVHSAVSFSDGSTIAQMSLPDMRLPISYALYYPERSKTAWASLDWTNMGYLEFEEPNRVLFPALDLAESAGRQGGEAPIFLNAANEVAVWSFLADEIAWTDIVPIVESVVEKATGGPIIGFDDVVAIDANGRQLAIEEIAKLSK